MPTAFREVFPHSGVDERTATGKVGIVVPLKGSNMVLLVDGPDLQVDTKSKPALRVEEVNDPQQHANLAKARHSGAEVNVADTLAKLKAKSFRLFKVTGNAQVGIDKATVEAVPRGQSTAAATLKVIVVGPKVVKIAIRPVKVRDDQGKAVSFTGAFDLKLLLNQMNAIWKPQANVTFEPGRTDPAVIDGLKPESEGADILNPTVLKSLEDNRDADAALTVFLVKRAYDGGKRVNGVTNARSAVVLLGEDRSENTLAHEAGHYLGAISEKGKYVQEYGHAGAGPDLLMREGGAGKKITFGEAPDFNKNYRAAG